MAHEQPGRLSGILERIQDMQGLPQTGEMLLGQIQQKAGDAPCMAGALEQADAFTKTSSGKRIYAWRKETMERSFAEAKELHGLRYARMLGIRNMYEQSFLTAAIQDMKRIAKAFRFRFSALRGCFLSEAAPFRPLKKPLNLEKAAFLASFGRSQRSWKILRHKALGLCPKPRRTPHFISSPFVGGLKPCAARFPCAFPRLRRRREQIQGLRAFRAHSVHICEEGKRVLLETIAADELFRHAAGRRAYFPMRGKGDPMLYL